MKLLRSSAIALVTTCMVCTCLAQSPSGSEVASNAPSSSSAIVAGVASNVVAANSSNPSKGTSASNDRGFTFSTSFTWNHDSTSGWSSVIDSNVRYDFNRVVGIELGMPYYVTHNGYSAVTGPTGSNPPLVTSYSALGDLYLRLHLAAPETSFGYQATITGTAPTGDRSSGISTGRPTFDLSNHFEHSVGFLTPMAEVGIGDSSALINRKVRRPYTTLGPLAHFKAGVSFDFLKYFNFEGSAYEELPIGDQRVFSHLFVRSRNGSLVRMVDGKKRRFARVNVDTGQGILEDNGLCGDLSINLGGHVSLTASYQRSLRQSMDTVALGMNFTFGRAAQKASAQ